MQKKVRKKFIFDPDPAKEYVNDGELVSTSPWVINYTNPSP